jgi:hypothetical protein
MNVPMPAPHSLSRQLLDHEQLMTPTLQQFFGPIYAQQHQVEESADIYRRSATLHQQLSPQHLLLEATLHIAKPMLPLALLADLRTSTTPFGALLRRYQLDIELRQRRITAAQTPPLRWGRSLVIYQKNTQQVICHVQEMLSPEANLQQAKALYDRLPAPPCCQGA